MTKQNYNIVVLLAIGVLALVLCIWAITARINGLEERVSKDEGVVEQLSVGLVLVQGKLDAVVATLPRTDDDSYYRCPQLNDYPILPGAPAAPPYTDVGPQRVVPQGEPCPDTYTGPCCAKRENNWIITKGPC